MAKAYKSWTISDELWEAVKDEISLRKRDPKLIPYALRSTYDLRSTLSFMLLYTGVILLLFCGAVLTSGDGSHYWYYFLCTISLSLLWAHVQLESSLLSKLIYILFFAALVQLYKSICYPLYQMEGVMPRERYAALDLLTACVMYAMFFLLSCLFKKIGTTLQMPPTRTALLILYFSASLLLGIILSVSFAGERAQPRGDCELAV